MPTTTVSGYLGAGKTTLVNRLLAAPHGMAITVLVNDFGEVALDETLIEAQEGDVISLANGCMCCQIGGALYDTIDDILRMRVDGRRIDHLVIETSGVADPVRISEVAVAEPELAAAHTLVLVDALNFAKLLRDALLADTLMRQVASATLIVITKADLAGGQAVAETALVLEEMAPGVPVLVAGRDVPHEVLFGTDFVSGASRARTLRHEPGGLFASWSWEGGEVPESAVRAFLERDLSAWRMKGVLRTEDGGLLVHRVGDRVEVERTKAPERSRLVAIGTQPGFQASACEAAWTELTARC